MEGSDLEHGLVSRRLAALAARLGAPGATGTTGGGGPQGTEAEEAWGAARAALAASATAEPDLVAAVEGRDLPALAAIVAAWESRARHLPEHDRTVLKRAVKAFRKSLKVTRLDAESQLSGRAMTAGRESGIVGMTPPRHYEPEVWDELVRQGRLIAGRHGTYELPPE